MQRLSTSFKNRLRRWMTRGESKRRKNRVTQLEQLETRRVLTAAVWNNLGSPFNVNGDEQGVVSAIDALLVINEIRASRSRHYETAGG